MCGREEEESNGTGVFWLEVGKKSAEEREGV